MKNRILIFMLVVVATIGMISCGKSNPASVDQTSVTTSTVTSTEAGTETSTETSTEPALSLAEIAGDFKLTMDNVDSYIETLAAYEGREVEVAKEEVSKELVDYYADYIFSNQAYSIEGWVAGNGDTVVMDYVGKMDDVAFDGGTASGASLVLGSGSYIPGFEEGLIGVKQGDVVDLNLTFPDPYAPNPDYSGKDCVFTVTVTRVIPGLSDAAVAALNNSAFTTAEEFTAYIESYMTELADQQYEQDVVQEVINSLVAESKFKEFPAELLAYEGITLEQSVGSDASYYGMTVAEYLAACGTSLEEQETIYAKEQVVFYKVAKEIGVTITEEDIDEKVNELMALYGYSEEQVYTYLGSRDYIYESIVITEVFDYLMGVTTVTAPEN